MTEKTENKMESLPDLDDLLQCPVCYEIPSGQIFQCNEGHHVCGRCKMRLDVCPVCRAFFFGTRNYAMEELISNVRKLQAFKLGGKVTTGSPPAEETPEVGEPSSEENESSHGNVNDDDASSRTSVRPPTACSGLFRCLCCKNTPERLPLARLLNHLRYYHSPDLIEGRSENDGYLQAWQFPTVPGKMVTAVRVHDMGIFFLIIEITFDSVHAWLSMAASPWVANEFSYSFILSGNDREAIFSDCVWSVRSCEGSLKRRGRCLMVSGADARALLSPSSMSGKLSVRRMPQELQPHATQPRAVLRVANRSNATPDVAQDLEPYLQDLQNDVARLSRAFATLGREANALVRTEAEMRARLDATPAAGDPPATVDADRQLSRSARRRMRQRLREALTVTHDMDIIPRPTIDHDMPRPAASSSRPAPYRPAAERPRPNAAQPATDVVRLTANLTTRPQNNEVSPEQTRPETNQAVGYNQHARPQNSQVTSNQNVRPQTSQVVGSNQNVRPQTNQAVNSNQYARSRNSQAIYSNQSARPQTSQEIGTSQNARAATNQVIGANQNARQQNSQAIGTNQNARATTNQVIGANQNARQQNSQAIGTSQNARATTNQVIGTNQNARQQNSQAIGTSQNARSQNNQAINTNQNGMPQISHVGGLNQNLRQQITHTNPTRVPSNSQNSASRPNTELDAVVRDSIIPRLANGQLQPVVVSNMMRGVAEVVSGPPVAPPSGPPTTFGGPSESRPADGNARNKKKRRQRR